MHRLSSALFVSQQSYLQGTGGVQLCTREYLETIEAAGIRLNICAFEPDRRISTRLLRRARSTPYFRVAAPGWSRKLADAILAYKPEFVFLNQVALAALSSPIRRMIPPNCKLVVLSHGLESTDLLHQLRLRQKLPLKVNARPSAATILGSALLAEAAMTHDIDLIVALSPFDADLERWVGARRVCFLPRTVKPAKLDWRPSGDRFGFVGTLDHAPNLDGLVAVLDRISAPDFFTGPKIRVVGGPARVGQWLASRYDRVDYLGVLDDPALAAEASTWNAFLHPIFCQARGASMKLATAIAWQIPIITSTIGRRGYLWREGELVIGDNVDEFAMHCGRLIARDAAERARDAVIKVALSSPTIAENAARFLQSLAALPQGATASAA